MERDLKLDVLKGVLIIFVVLGHILRFSGYGTSILMQFIYSFHIPLFVIISGYCTHEDNKKFWKTIVNLYVSFLIFQLLYGVVGYGLNILDIFLQPKWVLWYLFSLICWRLLVKVFYLKRLKPIILLSISFIIGILSGYIPIGYEFSIQRTLSFFPFFCIGYILQRKNIIVGFSSKKLYILLVCFVFLQIINLFIVDTPMCILRGALCYKECNIGNYAIFYRLFYYLLALICSYTLYLTMPQIRFLSKLGKDSLLYYLYHGLFLVIYNVLLSRIGVELNFFIILLELMLIMVSIYFLCKFKIAHKLVNPILLF